MKRYGFLVILALFWITPSSEAQISSGFGSTLAMKDGIVFVAKATNDSGPGTVYVLAYDEASQEWVEHQRLQAPNAEDDQVDNFGRSMVAGDGALFVGATASDEGRGAVYVFIHQDDGTWVQSAKLDMSDAPEDYGFGHALALRGQRLLVAARNGNAVHVFEHEGESGAWYQKATLQGEDTAPEDDTWKIFWSMGPGSAAFGQRLLLGEHTAFVTTPAHNAVIVYTHDPDTDTWSDGHPLPMEERIEPGDRFGYSLAMGGGNLFVSAPSYDSNQGMLFVFEQDESGEWKQTDRLSETSSEQGVQMRWLGFAMTADETSLWASAPLINPAEVHLYHRNDVTGQWESATRLQPVDPAGGDAGCQTMVMEDFVVVCGDPIADYGAGKATVFNIEDGAWTDGQEFMDEPEGIRSVLGEETLCVEGKANLFDCSNVDMLSFLSVSDLGGARGVRVNDLWGWTDPETGREWALIGRIDGTSMVDVTDPQNPVYVGDLPKTEGSNAATWRDIKVYQDHAFIVADGAGDHGMQVFDLRQLRTVDNPPVTFEANALYTGISSAHNIVINEDTGFAYSVGGRMGGATCGGGLHMIDIRDPQKPTFAGCFADRETGRSGTGYSHDAQCVIYHGPDAEHLDKEICLGSNETALSIADVTDKEQTVKLAHATYPNYGYSHQGWLTEDHRYFYMNDELDEIQGSVDGTRTLIWDISDLDDPQLVMEHISENKASDHNLYIVGDLMYQSNYQSGLRILDITDRLHPVEIGFFDTVPYGENVPSFGGSWSNYPFFKSGIIVVTSGSEGMFILKKREVDL